MMNHPNYAGKPGWKQVPGAVYDSELKMVGNLDMVLQNTPYSELWKYRIYLSGDKPAAGEYVRLTPELVELLMLHPERMEHTFFDKMPTGSYPGKEIPPPATPDFIHKFPAY
jgi:hypothetical protein